MRQGFPSAVILTSSKSYPKEFPKIVIKEPFMISFYEMISKMLGTTLRAKLL
jgi:hypothetical protein